MHISQWIILPTQSCLVLYSFCVNFLHSSNMWLMISSLSPHSLYLLFCFVLSILVLIWLVLMMLFCGILLLWEFFPTTLSFNIPLDFWVTASLLKNAGRFSVFWLLTGWSLLELWFLSLPISFIILWRSLQVHQLQLVSPSTSCSLASPPLQRGSDIYASFHLLWVLLWGQPGQ